MHGKTAISDVDATLILRGTIKLGIKGRSVKSSYISFD